MNKELPGSHKEHGFAVEVLHIFVSELLTMVVFEYLKSVRTLQLLIVEGLETYCSDYDAEDQPQDQFK
jgi:hypothetical protein